MKFYDLNKMKNSRIFFDQNPPRFIKYFILLVCLLVVVGLVLAIYVKKNYIVNVEGKVIFENTEYVISNVNGSIEEILKTEGEEVQKDDLLLKVIDNMNNVEVLELEKQREEKEKRLELIKRYEESINSYTNLMENNDLEKSYYAKVEYFLEKYKEQKYNEELLLKQIDKKNKEISEIDKKIDRLDDGTTSEDTYLEQQVTQNDDESKTINIEVENKDELVTEKESLKEEVSQYKEEINKPVNEFTLLYKQLINEIGENITSIKEEIASLDSQMNIKTQQNKNYFLNAKADGVVHYLSNIKLGMPIVQGEVYAEIYNPEQEIIIESYIPATEISKVHIGDKVKLSMKGVNTTKFGLIHGDIKDISAGTIAQQTLNNEVNYFYKAFITVKNTSLTSRDGEKISLVNGQPLECKIVYRKETYFQWFTDLLNLSS